MLLKVVRVASYGQLNSLEHNLQSGYTIRFRYKTMTVYACSLSVRCVGVSMEPRLLAIDKPCAKPGGHDVGYGHFLEFGDATPPTPHLPSPTLLYAPICVSETVHLRTLFAHESKTQCLRSIPKHGGRASEAIRADGNTAQRRG